MHLGGDVQGQRVLVLLLQGEPVPTGKGFQNLAAINEARRSVALHPKEGLL